MADRYATAHHEMRATVNDALQELPRLVWHMDEPHGDSAVVSTYLVSRFAASQLRVVLSGSGGDEVFGGYRRYFDGGAVDHLYRRLPQGLQAAGARRARRVNAELGGRLAWNTMPVEQRYLRTLSLFHPRSAAGSSARRCTTPSTCGKCSPPSRTPTRSIA